MVAPFARLVRRRDVVERSGWEHDLSTCGEERADLSAVAGTNAICPRAFEVRVCFAVAEGEQLGRQEGFGRGMKARNALM